MPPFAQIRAFSVHIFTALGAALALAALVFAVRHNWPAMFICLGIALIVDGIDGTFARYLRVDVLLPRWSGDVLDLVVDYTTYVFVPAYAIAASGLMPEPVAIPAGMIVVVTGALYFADTAMKTDDNYFRGFPTLWNAVVFYLFVLKLPPVLAAAVVLLLAVATFLSFKFLHPMRVRRLRSFNVAAVVIWSALALIAVLSDLDPGPWVTGGLVIIAVYLVGVGLTEKR